MTDLSELWIVEEGKGGQIVVGKEVRTLPSRRISLDCEAANQLFGKVAAAALQEYLAVEKIADDPIIRTGMPPGVVRAAQEKANQSKTIFMSTAHIPVSLVIESRPKFS